MSAASCSTTAAADIAQNKTKLQEARVEHDSAHEYLRTLDIPATLETPVIPPSAASSEDPWEALASSLAHAASALPMGMPPPVDMSVDGDEGGVGLDATPEEMESEMQAAREQAAAAATRPQQANTTAAKRQRLQVDQAQRVATDHEKEAADLAEADGLHQIEAEAHRVRVEAFKLKQGKGKGQQQTAAPQEDAAAQAQAQAELDASEAAASDALPHAFWL